MPCSLDFNCKFIKFIEHVLVKGTVHPKIKVLSSFNYPHIHPNLLDYVSGTVKGDIVSVFFGYKWKSMVSKTVWLSTFFFGYKHLPWCSAEESLIGRT